MNDPILIFGLGYTTQRLARRLLARGFAVVAVVRNPARFRALEDAGLLLADIEKGPIPERARGVYTIPPVEERDAARLKTVVGVGRPRRLVYISSTGVYGNQAAVDEHTVALPNDEKGIARLNDENWLRSLPECRTLVLRAAAIYGPGRGIHAKLREGRAGRSSGGLVSRTHVDDLVALIDAAIDSDLEGAFPVADILPASTEEVAAFAAHSMGLELPNTPERQFFVTGRSVDGRAIRSLLQVPLLHQTYREGTLASILEESSV